MDRRTKRTGGFTLVELVVVIAILGILAGAGTAGYAGYVKQAKKKADQTLVSNIVRAIEVGTNSTMFVNDDSFKMGQIAYPIGFITLTADEAVNSTVTVSNTEMTGPVEGVCEFVTIEDVSYLEPATAKCDAGATWGTYYTLKTGDITYCTTHSPSEVAPSALAADKGYTSSYSSNGSWCNSYTGCSRHNKYKTSSATVPAGTMFVDGFDSLYGISSNPTKCVQAYNYQYGSFTGTPTVGAAVSGNTLYDAIEAAFGDVESLKLQYNGWTSDEGVDYSTFYTSAPALMGKIDTLSDALVTADKVGGWLVDLGLAGDYEKSEDVLVGVAQLVVETYPTVDEWLPAWRAAAGDTWSGGLGFGLPGRETYSAARMGYNNAFGSYLDARGIEGTYTTLVKNYYTQTLNDDIGLPGLVNTSAFTDDASGLKQDFIDAGDATAGKEGSVFNKCAALYEEYKTSAACEENGRVFYQTLATFHETSDIAQAQVADGKFGSDGTIYDYYNGYVNQIAKLYEEAQKAAGDGIVIIVTVENGEVKCNVSPSTADLRNAD